MNYNGKLYRRLNENITTLLLEFQKLLKSCIIGQINNGESDVLVQNENNVYCDLSRQELELSVASASLVNAAKSLDSLDLQVQISRLLNDFQTKIHHIQDNCDVLDKQTRLNNQLIKDVHHDVNDLLLKMQNHLLSSAV